MAKCSITSQSKLCSLRRSEDGYAVGGTLRILAELDERQLRDIGLMRDDVSSLRLRAWHKCYRALANLDVMQLSNLSERGLRMRRETRREMHRSP